MDVEEFEPILSDEDILDDAEHYQDLDYDYTAYTNNDDLMKLFVPGTTLLKKHEKKPEFQLLHSEFESLKHRHKKNSYTLCEKITLRPFGEPRNVCKHNEVYFIIRTSDWPTSLKNLPEGK
ncbi:hypothetical protein FQR65_LT19856 [Abscondita terminalis]|nr:hypothetical protein FQR65_LT19856 [Abscondita terminalis]